MYTKTMIEAMRAIDDAVLAEPLEISLRRADAEAAFRDAFVDCRDRAKLLELATIMIDARLAEQAAKGNPP